MERKPLNFRNHYVRENDEFVQPTKKDFDDFSIKAQLEWAELETGHRHEVADEGA